MSNYIQGTINISNKGVGYVRPDGNTNRNDSIEIEPSSLNTALPGDTVKVEILSTKPEELPTGKVIEIITRKRLEFVGIIEQENNSYFLVPDDKRVYKDILIASDKLNSAKPGDKVLVSITEWTDPKKDPLGEVLLVIGKPGEHQTEMRSIIYDKGFRPEFPPEVEQEAKLIKAGAEKDMVEEIKNRRDLRQTFTCTIDPADAKDFDDAISLETKGDSIEIGIHIADVAHYVLPDTILDKEAIKRATSIYLVDRTIPMLPEILSNDLCSLKPNEDKLAFSAIFTFDQNYKIIDEWFGRTIIHSNKRLTYEDAQKLLDQNPEAKSPDQDLARQLQLINKVALKLRADKMANGAMAFESTEIKFVLDEEGRPLRVVKKERTASHLLIEDLMLLANRKVAEFVSKIVKNTDKRFVYRVHDQPDRERLKQLADFITPLGYKLKLDQGDISAKELNELLRAVDGKPEEAMIQTAVMRSMAKAIYSMKNLGHYGLAFDHYAHFTSPIRRYPDVMVHRLLDYYLRHHQPPTKLLEQYETLVTHSSQRELAAQEAERDSVRYKQIEFLTDKIGKVFSATISGLAKWGIFVQEVETLAEGVVRLTELKDDYYIFDEKKYAMVGKNTNRRYRLGDRIQVKLIRADVSNRVLDFVFV